MWFHPELSNKMAYIYFYKRDSFCMRFEYFLRRDLCNTDVMINVKGSRCVIEWHHFSRLWDITRSIKLFEHSSQNPLLSMTTKFGPQITWISLSPALRILSQSINYGLRLNLLETTVKSAVTPKSSTDVIHSVYPSSFIGLSIVSSQKRF